MQSFASEVDSIDCTNTLVAIGLSNLEGNTWDGGLKVLDIESGEEIQTIRFQTGTSTIRFIGEDKNVLVVARDDGSISIHDAVDLQNMQHIPTAHSNNCVSCIGTNNHQIANTFVTGGWDGSINTWDMYASEFSQPLNRIEEAHSSGPIHDVSVNPQLAAGNVFASVGQDGFIRIWDQRNYAQHGCLHIAGIAETPSCVAWNILDAHQLYTGTNGGSIVCIDLRFPPAADFSTMARTGKCDSSLSLFKIHAGRVRRIQSVDNSNLRSGDSPANTNTTAALISASDDTTVKVCYPAQILAAPSYSNKLISTIATMADHSDYVTDFAVLLKNETCMSSTTEHQTTSNCTADDGVAPAVEAESEAEMEPEMQIVDNSGHLTGTIITSSTDKTIRMSTYSFSQNTFY